MDDPRASPTAGFPELMKRAQSGDLRAYSQLLSGVLPLLRGYVARHLGGSADFEDVVQEILISLHRARHSYDPARPFEPWLMALARHRILDYRRRAGRMRRLQSEVDVTSLPSGANMEDVVAQRDLHHAISCSPRSQRTAVHLLRFRQLTLKEAARISGRTPSALKVAMHRALKSLRIAMGERL